MGCTHRFPQARLPLFILLLDRLALGKAFMLEHLRKRLRSCSLPLG